MVDVEKISLMSKFQNFTLQQVGSFFTLVDCFNECYGTNQLFIIDLSLHYNAVENSVSWFILY